MERCDCLIIGAGVVGLAVARALALQGREVLVLEAAGTIGTGTSSRNSEVIHAGLYYPAGSLKARLCVQGRQQLYAYCEERHVAHRRCGKLVVATSQDQLGALRRVQQHAAANGVNDLEWLEGSAARALEPALQCCAALLSPSTGIIDSHGLMLSLQADLENAGGLVAFHSAVRSMQVTDGAIALETEDGTELLATTVVNSAGLAAPDLARKCVGLDSRHIPVARYAKGSYFTLSSAAPFSRLVYPVPEAAGLGVHLTLDMGGQAKFGPDVEWVEDPENLLVDPARAHGFYGEVRKYWPGLPDGALAPGYAGIRPKIHGPGEAAADFMVQGPAVHGVKGLINLFGIESPGLTSSLALGAMVAEMAQLPNA